MQLVQKEKLQELAKSMASLTWNNLKEQKLGLYSLFEYSYNALHTIILHALFPT